MPPSAAYQVWKYARKHRVALATAGAFAAVLVAATAISLWQAVRATREEADGQTLERGVESSARVLPRQVLAAARPAGTRRVDSAMTSSSTRPSTRPSRRSPPSFADQPTVEAAIRDTLGSTYLYLGRPADAIQQHERALTLRTEALGV